MKSLSVAVACAFVLTAPMALAESNINRKASSSAQDATRFTKVIEDLPLMPGLEPQEEKDILFISGPGRIAQTTAVGMIDIDTVYHYYQNSLPQLGWKVLDGRTFERDGEKLRIDVSGVNPEAKTIVRFSVEPLTKGN